jgi:hypothetical protein
MEALSQKVGSIRATVKKLARYKRSSLSVRIIIDKVEKFYNIEPRPKCRTNTILFSNNAVITQRNGYLYLLVRYFPGLGNELGIF